MLASSNDTFLELSNVLISSNCPLISRTDHWWIEELLFKPGKPRTDLIVWIISKLINSINPNETNDDSNSTSTTSNNFRIIPESDEGETNQSTVIWYSVLKIVGTTWQSQ